MGEKHIEFSFRIREFQVPIGHQDGCAVEGVYLALELMNVDWMCQQISK